MRIFDDIHIRNFRGIREADISDFGSINIFFGKNNCGKSSLLEAIFLLTGPSNPMLPIKINALRSYGLFRESDMLLDFYNLNADSSIRLFSDGNINRELEITAYFDEVREIDLASAGKEGSNSQERFYGLTHKYKVGDENIEYQSKLSIQKGELSKGNMGVDNRYVESVKSMYLPSAYMQTPVNEVYGRLTENKKDGQIVEILRSIEPKIIDMKLVGQELMVDIGLDQLLPINMMGDGLRKLVSVVLAIYDCKEGVIAIDEIDNGFHYSAMKSLCKAIALASQESNTQVFITTHNIDFLKGVDTLCGENGFEWLKEEMMAFKLMRNKDDILSSLRYDSESIGYSIEQEIEIR